MAFILFCLAGLWIGAAFDLFALVCAMAFAVPAAFLVCADGGTGHAILMAGGILIALQLGFAVGLASQRLESPSRVLRWIKLLWRAKP